MPTSSRPSNPILGETRIGPIGLSSTRSAVILKVYDSSGGDWELAAAVVLDFPTVVELEGRLTDWLIRPEVSEGWR